jgi:hypothetical protein
MDLTAPVLAAIYNIVKDVTGAVGKAITFDGTTSVISISNHVTEADLWSGRIQFLGMPNAVSTDTHTQPLRITSTPRRFYGKSTNNTFNEMDFLARNTSTIILGDPGVGNRECLYIWFSVSLQH